MINYFLFLRREKEKVSLIDNSSIEVRRLELQEQFKNTYTNHHLHNRQDSVTLKLSLLFVSSPKKEEGEA